MVCPICITISCSIELVGGLCELQQGPFHFLTGQHPIWCYFQNWANKLCSFWHPCHIGCSLPTPLLVARAVQHWKKIEILANIEVAQNHLLNIHYTQRRISNQSLLHHHRHVVWHRKEIQRILRNLKWLFARDNIHWMMDTTQKFKHQHPLEWGKKLDCFHNLLWMLVDSLYSCMLKNKNNWQPLSKTMLTSSMHNSQHRCLCFQMHANVT